MLRQDGRDVALGGLECVVSIRAGQVVEDAGDLRQQPPAAFQGGDRVLEIRLCRIGRDGCDLLTVAFHGNVEGLAKAGPLYMLKRRRTERRRPGLKKWMIRRAHARPRVMEAAASHIG